MAGLPPWSAHALDFEIPKVIAASTTTARAVTAHVAARRRSRWRPMAPRRGRGPAGTRSVSASLNRWSQVAAATQPLRPRAAKAQGLRVAAREIAKNTVLAYPVQQVSCVSVGGGDATFGRVRLRVGARRRGGARVQRRGRDRWGRWKRRFRRNGRRWWLWWYRRWRWRWRRFGPLPSDRL
jgi:hypothetical protein